MTATQVTLSVKRLTFYGDMACTQPVALLARRGRASSPDLIPQEGSRKALDVHAGIVDATSLDSAVSHTYVYHDHYQLACEVRSKRRDTIYGLEIVLACHC